MAAPSETDVDAQAEQAILHELGEIAPVIEGVHCFRPESQRETDFFPHRIVEDNLRLKKLDELCSDITWLAEIDGPQPLVKEKMRTMLRDLIIHNVYGRIHSLASNAGDLVPVIENDESGKYKNCVAMIMVNGMLATVGGFNDRGEAMTQTIAREGKEEAHGTMHNFVLFGDQSNIRRDIRQPIFSCCAAALTDATSLQAGDDADQQNGIIIVKLINDDGEMNVDFFKPGIEHTDVEGKTFTHTGVRADHMMILQDLYSYWIKFSKKQTMDLAETVSYMSDTIPQDWFDVEPHPEGTDRYEKLTVESLGGEKTTMHLTPNVVFAREQVKKIFSTVGVHSEEMLQWHTDQFIARLYKADLLPLFPQDATTVDDIIIDPALDDMLIVHELPNGKLSLPGSFHSPELKYTEDSQPTDLTHAIDLFEKARSVAFGKYKIDFRPVRCLGTVGGTVANGTQADTRYPRLSKVFLGVSTGSFKPTEHNLPAGSKIRRIPIWKDKKAGVPSDEILHGLENKGWAYNHNDEILILLVKFLRTVDPDAKKTAFQIVMNLA